MPDSPTPLLTSIEGIDEESFASSVNGSTENDVRMHIGMSPGNHGGSENLKDEEGSAYMRGNNLEDDEEEPESVQISRSPYKSRPVLVQLAPDDRTEGYRGWRGIREGLDFFFSILFHWQQRKQPGSCPVGLFEPSLPCRRKATGCV